MTMELMVTKAVSKIMIPRCYSVVSTNTYSHLTYYILHDYMMDDSI